MENNNLEHSYSRALSYSRAIAEIFYIVIKKRCPLDRETKNYFREHDECGSKDRFVITESLFSLFRWYGWVKVKLPGDLPENPLKSKKFCTGLSAALWLDNQPFLQFMEKLYDAAEIDTTWLEKSPDLIQDKIKGMSYSFKIKKCDISNLVPQWFKNEILPDNDINSLIGFFQKRPPVWIRIQNNAENKVLKDFSEQGIIVDRHEMIPNAFKILSDKFNTNNIASYKKGLFEIQDLASQCLGLVCDTVGNQTWWDVCAGGGGKSLLLADQVKDQGKIVATGNHKEIEKRAKRADFKNIQIEDLHKVMGSQDRFDGVLVDAPCSCTGIWRRNPDLRWTSLEDVCFKATHTQKEIIEFASRKVKSGGVLVYATCSLSFRENEDVVEYFLKSFSDFELEDFIHPLTGRKTSGMMHIQFFPDDCDATFSARFRRK